MRNLAGGAVVIAALWFTFTENPDNFGQIAMTCLAFVFGVLAMIANDD